MDESSLPAMSVVIVFWNDVLSVIMRAVYSVISRTPPALLAQIILFDDASDFGVRALYI